MQPIVDDPNTISVPVIDKIDWLDWSIYPLYAHNVMVCIKKPM